MTINTEAFAKALAAGIAAYEAAVADNSDGWADCTDVGSGWVEWKGGECPACADVVVEVRFRNGEVYHDRADDLVWYYGDDEIDPDFEIVAYRVAK